MPSPGITKKAIAAAMKELMAQRPLAKINVGDIVERCGLNRNSFYYHFKDKFDLVNWIFYTEIAEEFGKDKTAEESTWAFIDKLCRYFHANRGFYLNALSVSGQNSFEEYYMDLLITLVSIRAPDSLAEDPHKEFYVTFFVDGFFAATMRWLREGAKIPPDEFSALVKKAATEAARWILYEATPE